MYSFNKTSPLAIFFLLNLLFFSLVTSYQPVHPPSLTPPPSTITPPPPSLTPPPPSLTPPPPTNNGVTCPRNTLNIEACANVLNLVNLVLNSQPNQSYPQCCSLIEGLVDLEARVCLCTALKLKIGGLILLRIPIDLNLIVNGCGRKLGYPYNVCPRS
ncbi:hypothetical protein Csa_009951 [Cucumis sativus]|nr:hypothetical protein Csa_009951 [Cucumis sativus]